MATAPAAAAAVGGLLAIINAIRTLPHRHQIEAFLARALLDLPGVAAVRVRLNDPPADEAAMAAPPPGATFPVQTGQAGFGRVDVEVDDAAAFAPLRPHLQNAMNLLALELDYRRTLKQLDDERHQLAVRVAEQTDTLVTLNEELHDAVERERAANRAKVNFLANLSHELRTPLNAISGFSEVMLSGIFGPLENDHYRDYAHDIHGSARHLLRLVEDILQFSRLKAGRVALQEATVALADLLATVEAIVAPAARAKDIALTVRTAPLALVVDARAIRQVVLNLVSNAVKFTPDGGRVSVEAGRDDDGACRIVVTDTGTGIEPAEVRHLLEPFERAAARRESAQCGVGLGLPIAYSLVALHGGDLVVDGTSGHGTRVDVVLPAERVRAAETVPAT